MVNLKVSDWEYHMLQLKADRISGGNLSELLRYAGLNFEPKKSDLVDVEQTVSEKNPR